MKQQIIKRGNLRRFLTYQDNDEDSNNVALVRRHANVIALWWHQIDKNSGNSRLEQREWKCRQHKRFRVKVSGFRFIWCEISMQMTVSCVANELFHELREWKRTSGVVRMKTTIKVEQITQRHYIIRLKCRYSVGNTWETSSQPRPQLSIPAAEWYRNIRGLQPSISQSLGAREENISWMILLQMFFISRSVN